MPGCSEQLAGEVGMDILGLPVVQVRRRDCGRTEGEILQCFKCPEKWFAAPLRDGYQRLTSARIFCDHVINFVLAS